MVGVEEKRDIEADGGWVRESKGKRSRRELHPVS